MSIERWQLVLAYMAGGLAEMEDCWCCRHRATRMLRMVALLADDATAPIDSDFLTELRTIKSFPELWSERL